ncbi:MULTISPECIES: hypothetical protein [Rhodomicrobium]|uniref:hypothetical protein n=1 Tax=Rhodomicrobium TaxID=1068 RepID=UPI000B4B8192|nr:MULTISPECIES: hypothetical protein [Rhodomicrobium]
MRARVYSVDDVRLTIFRSKPAQIVVIAMGRAASTGWTDAELNPFMYVMPPRDGILDLDFSAESPRPGTIVLPILTPIAATLWMPVPNWVRGVRVHAATNSKESGRNIEALDVEEPKIKGGDSVPWPWAAGAAAQ